MTSMANGAAGPIFVVGPSRSGTALLRAILNQHPRVSIAGETHYFDDLRTRVAHPAEGPLDDDERRRCQDYFLALAHRPFGHGGVPGAGWLGRDELQAAATAIGDGADAYFEAYCRLSAARDGADRWGDKTPRHIFRIDDILARYPDARVVCMIRDPRAVVASYANWTNQGGFDLEADPEHRQFLDADHERARRSYDPLLLSLLWRSQARTILRARNRHPRSVHVQRYEALVSDPEPQVRAIADFVGIDFRAELLDVPVLNSSFDQFAARGGLSTAPIARWRTVLGDDEIAAVQHACGQVMTRFGFERAPVDSGPAALAVQWARLPMSVGRAALANRERLGNPASYLWRRVSPLVGRRG